MAKIQVLDDPLINRIAAGEVVERPASVVKELVENSLDAGARRIVVQVVGGGKRVVRVADDGEGMDRDDALLCLERHATSKLRRPEDLERIATLGFRGEAIPSIAAVSRLLLRTATVAGAGTEIEVRAGRILAVREVAATPGTLMECAALFYNTPARRKFLKSDATEGAHAARWLTRLALSRPEVALRFERDGSLVFDLAAAAQRRARIAALFGEELTRELLPVEFTGPGLELEGWVSRPATARDRRDVQYLFVNGRAVHDRTLLHAVAEGFGNTMPHGRRPAAFLFLTVASVDVDVNVHPQKSEVRFARPWEVHDPIREAIRRALGGTTVVPGYGELRAPAPRSTGNAALPPVQERLGLEPRPAPETAVAEPAAVPAVAAAGRFQALAQFAESYILGADADGIVVVDQHAAHERVLFERFLAQVEAGQVEIQRLVVPQVVELTPAEAATLEDEAGELRRLGILVDAFGARAARVEGVPAVAAALDPGELLRQVLGDAARLRAAATGIAGLRRSLVTTAACRAAVKIHHHLHRDAMQALLDDLARTANPTTCPHGRPILFRLTRRDIERAFQRT